MPPCPPTSGAFGIVIFCKLVIERSISIWQCVLAIANFASGWLSSNAGENFRKDCFGALRRPVNAAR